MLIDILSGIFSKYTVVKCGIIGYSNTSLIGEMLNSQGNCEVIDVRKNHKTLVRMYIVDKNIIVQTPFKNTYKFIYINLTDPHSIDKLKSLKINTKVSIFPPI
jgi:hypothetical protein